MYRRPRAFRDLLRTADESRGRRSRSCKALSIMAALPRGPFSPGSLADAASGHHPPSRSPISEKVLDRNVEEFIVSWARELRRPGS
jgi:hypothetical protein